MTKRMLIINRKPPRSSLDAEEALDFAITAATLEQQVAVLFMDDGVFQLLRGEGLPHLVSKNVSKTLPALADFEIEAIYADKAAMQRRGLLPEDLVIKPEVLDDQQITQLMQDYDLVLHF